MKIKIFIIISLAVKSNETKKNGNMCNIISKIDKFLFFFSFSKKNTMDPKKVPIIVGVMENERTPAIFKIKRAYTQYENNL